MVDEKKSDLAIVVFRMCKKDRSFLLYEKLFTLVFLGKKIKKMLVFLS